MKKNVVIVSNMYPSLEDPAYGSFVKEQSEELEKRGICVKRVVSYDRAEGNKKRALFKYMSIWAKSLLTAFNPRNKIYHFHYVFPTAIVAPILKLIFRKKIVLTFHGSDLLKGGKKKDKILNFLFPYTDQIILVSDYLQNEFIKKFPQHQSKTHSIHCGVNDELFQPIEKEKARENLGLPQDKFIVLYLGRMIKDKGIDVFEKTIDSLKDEKDFHFVLVGDGQEKEYMETKYNHLKNVSINPSVPKNEVPLWFNASDVFVFPTKREAFGLVALESSACGTPVISHNVGGVPEIVENNSTGYLINLDNDDEFATKIQDIYDSPGLKNSFSIKGYEKSKEQTIEKQINKILNVYKAF